MIGRDPVEDRARARRSALDALGLETASASPAAALAWACVCHPFALAVLEHRAPGCAWFEDPFMVWSPDPKGFGEEIGFPVVRWEDGVATVNGLPMPRRGVGPGPDTVNGIDCGDYPIDPRPAP